MADLDQTIKDTGRNPKAVAVDGTRVDAQSVDDLIKADQLLAGKDAVSNPPGAGCSSTNSSLRCWQEMKSARSKSSVLLAWRRREGTASSAGFVAKTLLQSPSR